MRMPRILHTAVAVNTLKNTLKLSQLGGTMSSLVYNKIGILNSWYTRVIGLDELKVYQERVDSIQEKLLVAQEKRREIGKELSDIRKRSNALQDQIHKINRQDDLDKFLNLMKEETAALRLENETVLKFSECDRTERDFFTAFTNAVKQSSEKQREQLEYTKYLGIILSITGSFLMFVYWALKKDDMKKFLESNASDTKKIALHLQQMEDGLQKLSLANTEMIRKSQLILSTETTPPIIENTEEKLWYTELKYQIGASVLALFLLKGMTG